MVFSSPSFIAIVITTVAAFASDMTAAGQTLSQVQNSTATAGVRSIIGPNVAIVSYCGMDLVGGDQWVARYPNPDMCVTNCLPQTGCNAATWTRTDGGTCYFKRLTGGDNDESIVKVVPNAGAVSFVRPDNVTPTWLAYALSDIDMPGNDLISVHGDRMTDCSAPCDANDKCSAWTWTTYNGGTCWLKTKPSPYVSAPGLWAGIQFKPRNPSSCLPVLG